MTENLRVKITYKDRNLNPVSECNYSFGDYVETLRLDLLKLITDIEDIIYLTNGNTPKSSWGEAEIAMFNKIKHKILDKAGEIQRLPENLYTPTREEAVSLSFWENIFGTKK